MLHRLQEKDYLFDEKFVNVAEKEKNKSFNGKFVKLTFQKNYCFDGKFLKLALMSMIMYCVRDRILISRI